VGPRTGLDAVAKKKKTLPLREIEPWSSSRSLVNVLTELPSSKYSVTVRSY